MLTDDDVRDMENYRNGLVAKMDKIDCPYCRGHLQLVINLLDDVIPISRFNTLYEQDPEALERYRELIQKEYMLRALSIGASLVGLSRRIRLFFHRRHHVGGRGTGDPPGGAGNIPPRQ